MNLFDGKFDLVDGCYVDENTYKIQGNYTDNTGRYSSYDVQVGDIIYVDGSMVGAGLLRYKISELHFEEFYDAIISATVKWDMIEGIDPVEPFGGMEGIIGAIHSNGLTANITNLTTNGANEIVINKAQSYQTMLLGNNKSNSELPDLTDINEKIKVLEDKMTSVYLEWEDVNRLSFK